MDTAEAAEHYVASWFWTLDQLSEAVAVAPDMVLQLIGAGCAPGPIYVLTGAGTWWSALDHSPQPPGDTWYSPGAAWGLRRAVLMMRNGASATGAAQAERAAFISDFVTAIGRAEGAELAFPDCFRDGAVDPAAAANRAQREWKSWTDGGYGVCLRIFNAFTCIAKESLGAALKLALAEGCRDHDRLLRQAEALAGLILPFAPWQRASGTPGRTIDRLLSEQQLGRELPYD
jgi:hypothetical protein